MRQSQKKTSQNSLDPPSHSHRGPISQKMKIKSKSYQLGTFDITERFYCVDDKWYILDDGIKTL